MLPSLANKCIHSILTKRKIFFEDTFHKILFVHCVRYSTRIISEIFIKPITECSCQAFVMSNERNIIKLVFEYGTKILIRSNNSSIVANDW